jgi:hypothetical protein
VTPGTILLETRGPTVSSTDRSSIAGVVHGAGLPQGLDGRVWNRTREDHDQAFGASQVVP